MARPGVSLGRLLAEGMSFLMEELDDELNLIIKHSRTDLSTVTT